MQSFYTRSPGRADEGRRRNAILSHLTTALGGPLRVSDTAASGEELRSEGLLPRGSLSGGEGSPAYRSHVSAARRQCGVHPLSGSAAGHATTERMVCFEQASSARTAFRS